MACGGGNVQRSAGGGRAWSKDGKGTEDGHESEGEAAGDEERKLTGRMGRFKCWKI